uniref:Uncharacterized protein YydD, contains DUF2326 domain n=1 Tax=Candidatus Kentrum sp. MB TaxID=2138164 RepID=A0A450XVV0_9GAMM|nr:MAG: Uncharacterized protein YydD, contains DUF2326 domain [Candidatus Kentron sp. MB]VFK33408.1 MAG: Uncharacterized protein YydD, contains DUF2326 domain [Candidatus Kentron sp. MB]VFK76150.1 MAG: Uncharacterized protein YydD, contains DUF2326 domain [Candidatus Kentron sp. MB]
MIYRIDSTLPTFKKLEFRSGLNVLLARKEMSASEKQTRNRAGKTSMIEIVHFLTGADVRKDSLFREEAVADVTFGMEFDLHGQRIRAERGCSGKDRSRILVSGTDLFGQNQISNTDWKERLGKDMFGLDALQGTAKYTPTFRSLFAYLVRRQLSTAFTTPEKQATMQTRGDYQIALMYLLGLDWKIAGDWQQVRDREKTLKELKKAVGGGAFGTLIGKSADLRTQLAVAEDDLNKLESRIASFRVLPKYRELEAEADQITGDLSALANDNEIDAAAIRDLNTALQTEAPPPLSNLVSIYAEAGVVLPGIAIARYDEVRRFHESVIRNRRDYLSDELASANRRIKSREQKQRTLDRRRSKIMAILQSHGALDQFSKLQGEAGRLTAKVETLRQRFEAAEQLESTRNELEFERNRLVLRLRRDFSEQEQRLDEAIIAFEETSRRLYESAGSMTIDDTTNGPEFGFPMQGSRSKGIKNMQIFCFDLMLMRLCAKCGIGPGFLIHDSHLFDGVDGRQVISALKAGAEIAEELGFQYIVALNEDDAFKETIEGFHLKDHLLPVSLTDAREDGGLFGIRFG